MSSKNKHFPSGCDFAKTNIIMDVQRQHDIQEIPAAIKISVVKNLFKAVEALADGSDELISELSMVMMRGIVATKPEAIGRMTNLWLEKQVAVGEFISLLREHMKGTTNVLSTLTPIEHVLLVFKKVTAMDHDTSDIPFMIEHYLASATKCTPSQVIYTNQLKCHQLIAFAKHVFERMFPTMKETYTDMQVAFLLNVGGADALAARVAVANPHPEANWNLM